jgi:DNA-binding response OmpR family regulator
VPVVLLATDADQLHDEVDAAIADEATTVPRVSAGQDVIPAVKQLDPDLVVLDLQIGNMGGMATCLSLRSEEGAGRLDRRPVLMLLDRAADVFLARRSDADGWLVKPLDAFRLRRATETLLAGDEYHEGMVAKTEFEPMNVMHPNTGAENPQEPVKPLATDVTPSTDDAMDSNVDHHEAAEEADEASS